MEADLYNIVPSVGIVNQMRGNKRMGKLEFWQKALTKCSLTLADRIVEPKEGIRGFIARAYLYMRETYPKRVKINVRDYQLYMSWHKKYPAKSWELKRAKHIFRLQANKNNFIPERGNGI